MKEFIKLVIKFVLILFVFVGIIFGSVILYSKISGKELGDLTNNDGQQDEKASKTVLIAGLHPDGPLTDFIMIAKYNPKTGRVNALSIPRDTKVVGTIDGKINSAYATKKRDIKFLAEKVKDLTGISVDNYVLLDTGAVRKMVDAIGGIPMNVPFDMDYDDNEQNLHIKLKKGQQILDGNKAEQFIRFRKNNDGSGYPLGDVQRVETQQKFIKAAVGEVLKPSTLLKIGDLIKLGLESVKTDITFSDILGYLDDVKNFDTSKLRMETLPGEGKYIGIVSYFVHDSEKTKELVDEMFINDDIIEEDNTIPEDNQATTVSASGTTEKKKSEIKVEVLNGTTRNGLANSVATKLKEEGYNVTKIGNNGNKDSIKTTIINKTNNEYAKEIKKFLGKGTVKDEYESNSKIDVTVILGSDY